MMHREKIFVTGAAGFVGAALCARLEQEGTPFLGVARRTSKDGQVSIGDITQKADWSDLLSGCDVVVHLAARVHVMDEHIADPIEAFRKVNVVATENLARQAAQYGVRRFVFVSSVKVNGEATSQTAFSVLDRPTPQDAYGRSKLEAEQMLARVAEETGLEVTIVRPPLVYGPGVGANFLRLMQLVQKGIPLPLGAVRNLRSLVALDNLIDLLIACTQRSAAGGQTFLVSDGHDVSTPELVRMLAEAMGKSATLIPLPSGMLQAGAAMLGKSAAADRLLSSLQVDISHTRTVLGWEPVVGMDAAINATVAHFLARS